MNRLSAGVPLDTLEAVWESTGFARPVRLLEARRA
jgi:hypothetical protein